MVIGDLHYLETATEDLAIVGGRWGRRAPKATAEATSYATAIGWKTVSITATETEAVAGLFSTSFSGSYSEAKGFPKA